jgi:hypothetical protein
MITTCQLAGKIPQEATMSIFRNIVSAIFGSPHATDAVPAAGSSAAPTSSAEASAPSVAVAKPMSTAEVEAMIEKIADQQSEKYNWEQSIVGLMKLHKLDSSLAARKQLAQELGYAGALDGSAVMNVWLHTQVMMKFAESGGKVPDSLRN